MKILIAPLLLLLPFLVKAQIITGSQLKITDRGGGKLKNAPKKVYFREFNIGYQVIAQNSATSNIGNNSEKISMTAGLDSKLVNEDFIELTNKAYQKVASKLTAAGFEIMSGEAAGKIDIYKSSKPLYGGIPFLKNGYVYYSPSNTIHYQHGGIGLTDPIGKISKQLGDIPVIDFGMNISFANLVEDRKGGGGSVLKGNIDLGAYPFLSMISWNGDMMFSALKSQITIHPKGFKPFPIPGVIKSEKIAKLAQADYKYDLNMNLKYFQDKKTVITNPVAADRELYIQKVGQALDEYLELFINELIDNSK